MKEFISEEDLNEVAGGFGPDDAWEFGVTCSCGYSEHFKSFKDATKALIAHVGDGKGHQCHMDVNKNSNK